MTHNFPVTILRSYFWYCLVLIGSFGYRYCSAFVVPKFCASSCIRNHKRYLKYLQSSFQNPLIYRYSARLNMQYKMETSARIIRHDNSFLSINVESPSSISTSVIENETVLIVLNTPGLSKDLIQSDSIFQRLWDISSLRACADGGANRLFDATNEKKLAELYIPDFVRGDLDSLRSEVRSFYEKYDCVIEQDFDQDTNDLDKCLQAIFMKQQDNSVNYTVCVFGAFGGRFDQEMASINALYNWQGKFHRILLFTEETCAFLLPCDVRNEVIINDEIEGPTCGIIPLGAPANSITTSGLKWNLNGDASSFGGLVSTSNQVCPGEIVTIQTSAPLVWTTEIIRRR